MRNYLPQTKLTPREFADLVLSGQAVPSETPAEQKPIDPTRLELKHCEFCPRTFLRAIGTDAKTCKHCGPSPHLLRIPKPKLRYREPLMRNFDAVGAGTSRAYRFGRRAALAF